MTKVRTWAGLDVHAAATVACVVDAPSGELSVQRLPGRTSEVAAFCARLPAPVRVAYEAGPTGFELARALDGGRGRLRGGGAGEDRASRAGSRQDRPAGRRAARAAADDRRAAPGQGPKQRGGGAARSRPCARGHPRRSDAGAPPDEQAPAAPRRPLRGQRERVDGGPPRLAVEGRPRRARRPSDAARLPGRDRRPGRTPRQRSRG